MATNVRNIPSHSTTRAWTLFNKLNIRLKDQSRDFKEILENYANNNPSISWITKFEELNNEQENITLFNKLYDSLERWYTLDESINMFIDVPTGGGKTSIRNIIIMYIIHKMIEYDENETTNFIKLFDIAKQVGLLQQSIKSVNWST